MLLDVDTTVKGRPRAGEAPTITQLNELAKVAKMLTTDPVKLQNLMGPRAYDELERRFLEDALVSMPELVRVYLEMLRCQDDLK